MGIYFIMFAITMFVASIVVFVRRRKNEVTIIEDTILELLIAFMIALFWFITIPAIVIIGSAWLVSKLFTLDWKQDANKRDN